MVLKYKNNSINKISSCQFTSPGEHYLAKSTFSTIMPNTCHHSYDLNFKLKIIAEAELSSTRVMVECTFGVIKSRWRILLKQFDSEILFAVRNAGACTVLHNI